MSPNTNSIGAGRFNVALPLWEEEALLLNRAAGQEKSRVELIRELLLEGARVKFPQLASQIEQIRINKTTVRRAALTALLFVISIQSVFFNDDSHIRAMRKGRRKDDFCCFDDYYTVDPMDDLGPVTWESVKEVA